MNNEINTKVIIRDAFINLYKNKNINSIRITDLAKNAGINRGTFYLHYEDIYDLRREIEDELLTALRVLVNKESPKNIFIMAIDEMTEYFSPVLTFINENKHYMRSLLSNGSDDYFENNMKDIMLSNIKGGINNTVKSENNYAIQYMVSANISVIKKWLMDEEIIAPKEIALLLSKFTKYGPLGYNK